MKREVDIVATVEEVAHAFCKMNSVDQAHFFALVWRQMHELCDEAKKERPRSLNLGADWQFWQIGQEAKQNGIRSDAAEALGAMSAPLYTHTLGL
jgi:hypothetical protein